MRQRDPLSPAEARELDALERALAGDPVDTASSSEVDVREFVDLVHDIRATAPQMSPGFAARLEQEVADGFPETQQREPARRVRRWLLLPAAGSLAAVLVALVVVLGNQGQDDAGTTSLAGKPEVREDSSSSGGTADRKAAPALAAPPRPPATSDPAASSGTAVAPPPSVSRRSPAPAAPVAPTKTPRRVQRSAELVLAVPSGKLDRTADGVIRTVDRFGGIVASSAIGTLESTGEATFDLRIPTDSLDEALAALSKLGHVAERSQNLVDITGSFTSTQDRLSDARAERRGLLRALGRASTQARIDSLRARLRTVRSQIARLNGELDALRRRADLSTVSVTVRGDGSRSGDGDGEGEGGGWSTGDAARDALRVLEVSAGVLLIALAVAAPLALLAGLAALGVRSGRRRRRESALDPA